MKNEIIALLTMFLFLSACAGSKTVWNNDGVDNTQREKDERECSEIASKKTAVTSTHTGMGGRLNVEDRVKTERPSQRPRSKIAMKNCMEDRGYVQVNVKNR